MTKELLGIWKAVKDKPIGAPLYFIYSTPTTDVETKDYVFSITYRPIKKWYTTQLCFPFMDEDE